MYPLILLGDSHIQYINLAAEDGLLGQRRFETCMVDGATAIGLRNPNCNTNAIHLFRKFLLDRKYKSIIIIQLGEVDCGFVIWYRSVKYQESIAEQLKYSIAAYFSFIDEIINIGLYKIIITGATLPTILDNQDWGQVANKRREVNSTLKERTQLTLTYNLELKKYAESRNVYFADITDDIIDNIKGIISPKFRNSNPLDHHLDCEIASHLWARQLNKILREI